MTGLIIGNCMIDTKKELQEKGSTHKTFNRHSRMYCCACSCIFVQKMIVCTQLKKLEFDGGTKNEEINKRSRNDTY